MAIGAQLAPGGYAPVPQRIDLYVHVDVRSEASGIEAKLDRVLNVLNAVLKLEISMSQELDALEAQVTKNEDLEQSAITLIKGIAAQLAAAKDDPVKIAALSASLNTSAQSLAEAIAANTPAA